MYFGQRLIIITGHYGSGKTNVAVNLALRLAAEGEKTALLDFDIVNPYFRAADSRDRLIRAGIRCIIPEYANSNVDIPSLPSEVASVFCNTDERAVFDVGGDDAGATALRVYRAKIIEAGYDMAYVFNSYRPLTATPEEAMELLREIEYRSGLRATALVNNSNLGEMTDAATVEASREYSARLAELSGLPLAFCSVMSGIKPDMAPLFEMKQATKKYTEFAHSEGE